MAIQTFTAAQRLTAAQMNALQANDYNQTVSAKVASYTLVAADKGTRITMSNAAATTITVNTSLFAAGDSLRIQNIGAGVCTITAGTATVTSAGPLALVQWAGGQLFFTSASAAIWFPDAVTTSAGALVRVGGGSLSGTSTAFANVFSATYDAYAFTISNLTTTLAATLNLTFGATTSNYYYAGIRAVFATGAMNNNVGSSVSALFVGATNTDTTGVSGTFVNPFLAARTMVNYSTIKSPLDDAGMLTGILNNTTSYTGFTLTATTGNLGGTVNIYGYSLS